MAPEDGTVLRDGENELNEIPVETSDDAMPIGTGEAIGAGRATEPMGEGDDPLGDQVGDDASVAAGDPTIQDTSDLSMGGGVTSDPETGPDEDNPDGTDETDGGGV